MINTVQHYAICLGVKLHNDNQTSQISNASKYCLKINTAVNENRDLLSNKESTVDIVQKISEKGMSVYNIYSTNWCEIF